jgi:hypothetical protein
MRRDLRDVAVMAVCHGPLAFCAGRERALEFAYYSTRAIRDALLAIAR